MLQLPQAQGLLKTAVGAQPLPASALLLPDADEPPDNYPG